MNMVEEWWSSLGSTRETQGIFQHYHVNNHKVNPPKLYHPKPRGANHIQMVVPHLIQWNKVEKTSVGGVVLR
jgi:hypothetical protein